MGDSKVTLEKSGLKRDLGLVEYPGFVKNDEKMLKTLGGISKISQAFCEKKKRLELKFHPDNVYNKPTFGDVHETGGILIKVKIRKPENPGENPNHRIEILGKCRKVVKFNSLCDYQYLPLLKNPETGNTEYIYDKIVPPAIPDLEWFEEHKDQQLFCIPSIFSRSDSANQNIHRGHQRSNLNSDVIAVIRNKNIDSVELVPFNLTDPFPNKPDAKVLKRLKIKYVSDEDLQRVKKCFEANPIWNKMSLMYDSKVAHDKLKCILPSVAYYFGNGPWRTMYVRYGYDPRKHFESRFYQTFDWRMRKDYGLTEYITLKRMQDDSSFAKDQKFEKPQSLVESYSSHKPSYPYLEEGKLPSARQCMYRYCDLRFSKIQEMLDKLPTPLAGAMCNEKIGWLPLGFEDECREIIWSSLTELTKTLRQKDILKSKQDINVENESSGNDDTDSNIEDFDQDQDVLNKINFDESF